MTGIISNNAGRDSEMALQLAKSSKALKRDMETALTQNVARNAGNASTARKLGGLETWISTNVSRGAGSPAGAGAGGGGDTFSSSDVIPKGTTIYGRWTSVSVSTDGEKCICYIG